MIIIILSGFNRYSTPILNVSFMYVLVEFIYLLFDWEGLGGFIYYKAIFLSPTYLFHSIKQTRLKICITSSTKNDQCNIV